MGTGTKNVSSLLSYNVMIGKDQKASHHSIRRKDEDTSIQEEDLKAIMEIYDLAHSL